MTAPLWRWSLRDYMRPWVNRHGEEPSSDKAKAALAVAIKRAGGLRGGSMKACVDRPSGGGWFARAAGHGLSWEEWEPEIL